MRSILLRRYGYVPDGWISLLKFLINRAWRKIVGGGDWFSKPFNMCDTVFVSYDGYRFRVHDSACLHAVKPDRVVLEVLEKHLHVNATFIDVGAHIGGISIRAASRCRQVIAIEPDPRNFTYLLENIKLNNVNNIVPILAAAWREHSLVKLGLSEVSTHSSAKDIHSSERMSIIYLPSISIDMLVMYLNIEKIDLVKIDVEGAEVEVLEGMVGTLEEYRPILLIEAHGREKMRECIDILRELKYNVEIVHEQEGEEYTTYQLLAISRT